MFFKDRLINDKSLRLTENWYSNNLIYWWLLEKSLIFLTTNEYIGNWFI